MSSPAQTPPWRTVWREHRKMLVFFGFVTFLLSVLWLYHWTLDRQIADELAAIRARGESLTIAEIESHWPTLAGGVENAAPKYRQAIKWNLLRFSEIPKTFDPSDDLDTLLHLEVSVAIEKGLDDNKDCLEALREAYDVSHCVFGYQDWYSSADSANGLGAELKALVDLLCFDALWQTEKNHSSEAVRAMDHAWRVVGLYGEESDGEHREKHFAAHRMAFETLQRVLSQTTPDEAGLLKLRSTIRSGPIDGAVAQELIASRANGYEIFEKGPIAVGADALAVSAGRLDTKQTIMLKRYAIFGLWKCDELRYLRTMNQLVDTARGPTSQRIARLGNDSEVNTILIQPHSIVDPMVGITGPKFKRLTSSPLQAIDEVRAIARQRLAIAALCVESFRLTHAGKLPLSLADVPELTKEESEDPFTGKSLVFKPLEKGFIVYSVGPDLTDDGGVKENPPGPGGWLVLRITPDNDPGTDMVFEVRR